MRPPSGGIVWAGGPVPFYIWVRVEHTSARIRRHAWARGSQQAVAATGPAEGGGRVQVRVRAAESNFLKARANRPICAARARA
jgi:hypothetical protein